MAGFVRRKERLTALRDRFAGTYTVQFRYDPKDLAEMYASLRDYEPRQRRIIMRNALKGWIGKVESRMRLNVYKNAHNTRAHVASKVKVFRRAIWSAAGVETGRRAPGTELRGRYGDMLPGWRSHLYEVGWTPYPQNFLGDEHRRKGKGRGWRRGLRKRRGGARRYETKYMRRAYWGQKGNLRTSLDKAVGDYNRRLSRASARAARRDR